MQQTPGMIPAMPSVSAANITTEQIQKYLDENKKLISAIMENQNLGKLAECAQYQALLQKNLMYLAAIADAQPQTPAAPPQVAPHPSMSPGGYYMQHPQSAPIPQQPGAFPRMPLNFSSPPYQSHEQQQQQQQQAMQGQMGNRSGNPSNSVTPPASTAQKERHAMEVGPSNADGRGTLGARPRGGEGSNER